jgi:hypothetical protein
MGILAIGVFLIAQVMGNITNVKAGVIDEETLATSNPDIVVITYSTSPSTGINKGDIITISKLKIENISGNALKHVYMVIDENRTSSFIIKSTYSTINLTDELNGEETFLDGENSNPLKLEYTGGSDTRVPITFYYDGGSTSTYLRIDARPDSDDTDKDPIDTTKFVPNLNIINASIPSGKAGDTVTVSLSIKNSSSSDAEKIVITPQLSKVAGEPFEADSMNSALTIPEIESNSSEAVNFRFRISELAAGKTYPIDLNFKFENSFGDSFTSTETIYVKVTALEGDSKLIVKDLYSSEPIVLAGGSTAINISIINSGTLQAKDIRVSLQGLKEEGFTLLNGANNKYIDSLNAGGETAVSYQLAASKKMTKGNYGLTVKVEYKDYTGKDCTEEQQFFIPVEGEETNVKTVPKIILDQYSSSPSIVKAGQNFQLSMSFLNTSEAKLVKNIKIYLTVNETSTEGANIFTPVNSSNTFFIDSIDPKGKVSKALTMYTIPDAKQKTYTISANFEYEDGEGNEYKATELIGVPVTQTTNVDTSEIAFPPEAYPGQPVPVSFDFYNTGKTLLRNFMIKLEGDFQSQNGSYFVGNFDVGASDHYEASIIPGAPGQLTGAIVISFDDPTGQKSEIKKDFTMNVMEMPVQENPGMGPGMKPDTPKEGGIKGLIKNKFLWIGLGIIAAAIVTGIIIRKKIIKKREDMTLDE